MMLKSTFTKCVEKLNKKQRYEGFLQHDKAEPHKTVETVSTLDNIFKN